MTPDLQHLIFGTVQGIVVSVVMLLGLLIGFCVVLTLPKMRTAGRHSMVVRSLDERLGEPVQYLPPDAPRGQVDQLAAGTRRARSS